MRLSTARIRCSAHNLGSPYRMIRRDAATDGRLTGTVRNLLASVLSLPDGPVIARRALAHRGRMVEMPSPWPCRTCRRAVI